MEKYLEDQKIKEFMFKNGLTEEDLKPYILDIKKYLSNPKEYNISWVFGLELSRIIPKNNPGIIYAFQPLFGENVGLSDLDIVQNPSKLSAITKQKENTEKGLFLTGPNGIGKTFLAIALANEYYKATNIKTLYVTMPELVYQSLSFNDNHKLLDRICNAKRLVIDEIGNERISEWSRDAILLPIITKRVDNKLNTTLISNYSLDELAQRYTIKAPNDNKSVKTLISKMNSLTTTAIIQGKDYRNEG